MTPEEQYIYKKQRITQSDLDEINKSGAFDELCKEVQRSFDEHISELKARGITDAEINNALDNIASRMFYGRSQM